MNYTIVNGELCHYGVKGMKWGVKKAYELISNQGSRTLQKKHMQYANKSSRAQSRGHNLRSAYYRNKADRFEDRSYNDIESFYAGIKDLSLKARSVTYAASVGKSAVKSMLETNNRKRAELEIRDWNRKNFY